MAKLRKIDALITSPPDREKAVLEAWVGDEQLAEINHEHDVMEIEIYPKTSGQPWKLDLADLEAFVQTARADLKGKG